MEEMFQHINKKQIELKYGGTQPEKTIFWPPSLDNSNIQIETDIAKLLTIEEY